MAYGLAFGMLLAGALPAMAARTVDVCVVAADENATSTFFTAAAPVFPKGTITDGVLSCPAMGAIGTFYTQGGFLAGPDTQGNAAFVTWDFVFDSGGDFVTVGPVDLAADYKQTIVGASKNFPRTGRIKVHNITLGAGSSVAFAFTVTLPANSQ